MFGGSARRRRPDRASTATSCPRDGCQRPLHLRRSTRRSPGAIPSGSSDVGRRASADARSPRPSRARYAARRAASASATESRRNRVASRSNGTVASGGAPPYGRRACTSGRPPVVPALGTDHRRLGQSRSRCHGRDTDERPRLLDVLRPNGRERSLHGVLPRLRQVGSRPGRVRGAGRLWADVVHDRVRNPTFKRLAARRSTCACPRRYGDAAAARRPRRPARSTAACSSASRGPRCRQARLRDVARCQGRFTLSCPASAGKTLRLLAERLPDVPDESGDARRPRRSRGVAEVALAPCGAGPRVCPGLVR